ncbi:MAG TPA: sensor histidine kinase [Saprospiraceae bacterium]|nr:sensor histidine kinase [Saprospiraceae bacterium]
MNQRQKRDLGIWVIHELYFTSMSTPNIGYYHDDISWFHQIFLGVSVTLLLLPAKLIPVYFGISPLVRKVFLKTSSWIGVISKLILSIIFGILAYRMAMYLIVYPFIFNIPVEFALYTEIQRWLSNLSEILVPMLLFGSIWIYDSQNVLLERSRQLEKEKLEMELQFLKNQTNPHFLFNTLNTIFGLIRKNQKAAEKSIIAVSDLLRYLLYECNAQKVSLEREQLMMEKFVQLQNLRFGERTPATTYWCQPHPDLIISPGILLPLIENAYKYSYFDKMDKGVIFINSSISQNNEYTFSISNPFQENVSEKEGGIGLKNLERQLQIEYPDKHSLQITKEAKKFSVTLKIKVSK